MAWYSWSKTAATNASADVTVNWQEGQPPSSVNDSARAMMARAAEYRDDIAGALTTSGTSTAYTLATNQIFDSLAHMANAMVAFVPHTTNGATVTLAVDGLTAKPLRAAPSVELQTGALIQGTPYVAFYNSSDGVFYLHGASNYNSYSTPLGGMLPYIGATAPNSSFVLPYGQAISRTTYATLFSLVSTTYGTGDGSTTFNVPDLRGRVVCAPDGMGGSSANRIQSVVSNSLGAVGGAQSITLDSTMIPSHTHTGTTGSQNADHYHNFGITTTPVSVAGGVGTAIGTVTAGGATTASITQTQSGNHQHTFTSDATGGGGSHANVQPTIALNYILRII